MKSMKRQYLAAIGFMIVLALALLTKALLFLHPTAGDGAFVFRVRFQNVDKISPGTRVTFAGKAVGEVKKIELLPEAFAPRTKANELIFPYEVKLAIDSSVRLYKGDEISVKTAGLMGERFIAITPRPVLKESDLLPVEANDILYAAQAGSVEETFGEISTVAKKADLTMEALISLIERNQEGLFKTTEAIYRVSLQLETLLKTMNTEHGSFSRLLKDPNLYDALTSSTQKAEELFSDIHSYGLLFHLNKDWQREMYRRKQEASSLPLSSANSTDLELRKVTRAMQMLDEVLSSLDKTCNSGTLSKNKSLQKELREELQNLQNRMNFLQETIQKVDLSPDE